MDRMRIAVLLGQADEQYQSEFLKGFLKEAYANNADVCVFSMYIKYQSNRNREIGDSGIYRLVNYDIFDAVLLLSDTIQTPGVIDDIEERIHRAFRGPVLSVDRESNFFRSFWTDGYRTVYALIEHLIKEHGYKDIAFLTGRKLHRHSIMRLKAYTDCMETYGLPVREDRIFYGDFWYTSGSACAEALLRDRDHLPEAVACANDNMAIGLCETLVKNGVRVPEDVAVTGYGSTPEGRTSPQPITSAYVPAEMYGSYSADALLRMIKQQTVTPPIGTAELFIGSSCGCEYHQQTEGQGLREGWATVNSEEGYYSVHNVLAEDMMLQHTLEGLLKTVYDNLYHGDRVDSFHLCLNDQWLTPDELYESDLPEGGYSEKMLCALEYHAGNSAENCISCTSSFETKDMLPELFTDHEPGVYFFTPVFFENISHGYAVLGFGQDTYSYKEDYRLWIQAVGRGLESLRRNYVVESLYRQQASLIKFPTDMQHGNVQSKIEGLEESERLELSEVERLLNENLFTYHFQPIVNSTDGEIYSYEALMRSNTSWRIPPLQIIKHSDILGRLDDVERATFINVLSILDNNEDLFVGKKVFINSIPGSMLSNEDFDRVNTLLKKHSKSAVVELTEQAELEETTLLEMKRRFREHGIGIAVDDYGTGYSNVSNLLRYMPNYVKIDRSLLSEIQNSMQKQHFVREIIEFCHANDIMALAEGVETSEELRMVILLGADLIQGFYTARPSDKIVPAIDENIRREISRYQKERQDGLEQNVYFAGRTNRISLNNLVKEGKTTILIGDPNATYRDLTIVGTPGVSTQIHLEIQNEYQGRVTLENVYLSDVKNRPGIDIASGCDVALNLVGENFIYGGGICVPKSSKLSVYGEGNLKIKLNASRYYGIGNGAGLPHGDLDFYQNGEIYIEASGQNGVGIGSWMGGGIRIHSGKYTIKTNGHNGVAIGAFSEAAKIDISNSDIEIDSQVTRSVCIGSVENNADIDISYSSVKCYMGGSEVVGVGSVDGASASLYLHDATLNLDIRAEGGTGIGSLHGASRYKQKYATLRYDGSGRNLVAIGGYSEEASMILSDSDINLKLITDHDMAVELMRQKIRVNNCRFRFKLNGEDIHFNE